MCDEFGECDELGSTQSGAAASAILLIGLSRVHMCDYKDYKRKRDSLDWFESSTHAYKVYIIV